MIAVVGSDANEATAELVAAWRALGLDAQLVAGRNVAALVGPDDVVIGRLDVRRTLDGVEPGLLELLLLERRGVTVVNGAPALLAAHDKWRTARLLGSAHLPHPKTILVAGPTVPPFRPPWVLKPRFGSWGRDVYLCGDVASLVRRLTEVRERPWFRRHGALVQQAIPNGGRDLRIVLAAGRLVGAAERVAGAGEWRTNVSCGGELRPTRPDADAVELARSAAAAIDADLVGVDLIPTGDGRFVVLELNGAVEFEAACALDGLSVPEAVAGALGVGGRSPGPKARTERATRIHAAAHAAVARSVVLDRESRDLVARVAAQREERRLLREDHVRLRD